MAEYPDPNEKGDWPLGVPAPRKPSSILTDRLMQVRERAEQAERQRDEAAARNRELGEQVETLREALKLSAEEIAAADHGEAEALRQELELVRTRAVADLEALRQHLSKKSQDEAATRNVGLEAELQSARQETAMLRQAVKEKDKVLDDLAVQCRSLEDVLEDRDREIDRLHQDLEQSRYDSALSDESVTSVSGADPIGRYSDSLYTFQENDTSEVVDEAGPAVPSRRWPHRTFLLAAGAALLVGGLAVTAVFLLPEGGGSSPGDTVAAPESPQRQSSTEAPTAPGVGPRSRASATVESKTAEPVVDSVIVEPQPVLVRDPLRSGSQGPLLATVPGGAFVMGNKRGVLNKEERPAHRVELRPYFIGKYEVTFAQYDIFARSTGRRLPDDFGWGRGERPVIDVTWDDAQAYTRWLSAQTGKSYRLPTEAEWEYAARGGSADRYWWGISPGSGRAVCFDCGSQWDNRRTAPVGSMAPNPYGLHDTAGNVMEWVADCYNPNYKGAPEDGAAWVSGDCGQRMVRGGAFNKPSSSLRSAARYQLHQGARFNMLGFRVVRE